MKEKEVSMSELFFDLIFVYVLSQINHTVEHQSYCRTYLTKFADIRKFREKYDALSGVLRYLDLPHAIGQPLF